MKKYFLTVLAAMFISLGASFAADHPSKKLYDTKCAACHAKNLKGNAMMAQKLKLDASLFDLTSAATAEKSDDELIKITSKGSGKMPGYEKSLKPEEIKGLIDYIRSVTPKKASAK